MKVAIPYFGELQDTDARLARLIQFLGIACETISLPVGGGDAEALSKAISSPMACLVVNPSVMEKWLGRDRIPGNLTAWMLSSFPHIVVHGVRPNAFDSAMVAALSGNRLESVCGIDGGAAGYAFAPDSEDVCSAFSGLRFGPANPENDRVFAAGPNCENVRSLISIGGRPFMALVKEKSTTVMFVASGDVAEPGTEVGGDALTRYFSRFVPHVMALRFAAGAECWRPTAPHASITIDDPLLRRRYGFLKFETLLSLARRHKFHATIAFIPHNCGRSSPHIARMFRENGAHLSICFHGNDHTGAEFGSHDPEFLDALLRTADRRMALHQEVTGIPCDRVMVFPQGNFSPEAMRAIQSHNFLAAVNTSPNPVGQPVRLTIADVAQPALVRYGGFPLFLRTSSRQMQRRDIAFHVFFGRPIVIVEHHDGFRRPEAVIELVEEIEAVAPGIQWRNLATAVSNSILLRKTPEGAMDIRAYSSTVRVRNDGLSATSFSVRWAACPDSAPLEGALVDGRASSALETQKTELRVSLELPGGGSGTVALAYRSAHAATGRLGLRWNSGAFLRRRLSEVRDNYLSKNEQLLEVAKAVQRSVWP